MGIDGQYPAGEMAQALRAAADGKPGPSVVSTSAATVLENMPAAAAKSPPPAAAPAAQPAGGRFSRNSLLAMVVLAAVLFSGILPWLWEGRSGMLGTGVFGQAVPT